MTNLSSRAQREKNSGFKYGCLTATVLPLVHAAIFVSIAALKWPEALPTTWSGWLGLLGASVGLMVAYGVTFLLLVPVLLYLSVKDRDSVGFLRWNWPLVVAVLYPILNPIPGPFDDLIVAGLAGALRVWFFVQQRRLLKRGLGDLTEGQMANIEAALSANGRASLLTGASERLPDGESQRLSERDRAR